MATKTRKNSLTFGIHANSGGDIAGRSGSDRIDYSEITGNKYHSQVLQSSMPECVVWADDVPMGSIFVPHASAAAQDRSRVMRNAMKLRQWWYIFSTVCAVLGMVFGIIENELLWANGGVYTYQIRALKIAVLITSVMAGWGLQRQMHARIQIARTRGDALPQNAGFWTNLTRAGMRTEFLTDIALLAIMPYPGLEASVDVWDEGHGFYIPYSFDAILAFFMVLVRIKYVLFCLVLTDPLTDATSSVYARSATVNLDLRFILATRCKGKLRFLALLWLLAISVSAYCMLVAERPFERIVEEGLSIKSLTNGSAHTEAAHRMDQYHNCLWLVIITMTTVGYGDIYPSTDTGRIVAVISCFEAVVLVALCIDITNTRLALDDSEQRVVDFTYRVREFKDLRRAAVRVIERIYMVSPIYRKIHPDARSRVKLGDGKFAEQLVKSWGENDKMGLGAMGDETLMKCIRHFRAARSRLEMQESAMRSDVRLQLNDVAESLHSMESEIEQLVDQVQASLHKLTVKNRL